MRLSYKDYADVRVAWTQRHRGFWHARQDVLVQGGVLRVVNAQSRNWPLVEAVLSQQKSMGTFYTHRGAHLVKVAC